VKDEVMSMNDNLLLDYLEDHFLCQYRRFSGTALQKIHAYDLAFFGFFIITAIELELRAGIVPHSPPFSICYSNGCLYVWQMDRVAGQTATYLIE
jgi:hypothetical protein